jgi:MFS transporter, PAT family, beta-lactamase induction signal transducer AmpG
VRRFPSFLWAVLTLPFGLTVGFATVVVPFVLRERGLGMTTIATVSLAVQLPHVIKLLWSPALDGGWPRRWWYLASVAAASLCLPMATLVTPVGELHLGALVVSHLWLYTALLFMAQAGAATSGSAVLTLMALSVPEERRGVASGWQTAGNLVGTAMGGALVAWMLVHASAATSSITIGGMCAVSALPAMLIHEPRVPRRRARALVVGLLQEAWATLRSQDGWTGLVICLSPVGAGALTNLFSALAKDYAPDAASVERLVVVVNGVLAGVLNGAGALLGGYLADRMNRRLAYVLSGGITGLCAIGMMASPATPTSFTLGCLAYQLANGLSYAAFYAFVLELLGKKSGVATQLALYVGVSNFAVTYVTWLDGWSYDRMIALFPGRSAAGRIGMLGMDALSTFVGIAILWAMVAHVRRARERQALMAPQVRSDAISSDVPTVMRSASRSPDVSK